MKSPSPMPVQVRSASGMRCHIRPRLHAGCEETESGGEMALINYLTRIQFGFGSLALLQTECDLLGIRRPLVVTDAGVRKVGILDQVLEQLLSKMAVTVFDATPPNPNEAAVRAAVQAYKEGDC